MIFKNIFAKLPENFYTKMSAEKFVQNPQLLNFNDELGKLLNIDHTSFKSNLPKWIESKISGCEPLAMVYAGHQFGHLVPRLGDGRALLLTQVEGNDHKLYDLQLKGSGLTPYSRMGDGRAVLRSSIREYLCGEAMHHLKVKTTRALALIATNENVLREEIEQGAMILRVARSHIRFGHFEYFYYSNQHEALKTLADHAIENYFPQINSSKNKYEEFLQIVMKFTAEMIANWQAIGFCHGVMNTDNMSITGATLDYGPFGFLEEYNPAWICNHSDHSGRYSYQNQPQVAAWNFYALCFAMQPLVALENSSKIAQEFLANFEEKYFKLMRKKIGLNELAETTTANQIWQNLLKIMQEARADYSLVFSNLIKAIEGDESSFLKLFEENKNIKNWLENYLKIMKKFPTQKTMMQQINPRYILRNWILQKTIEDAKKGDLSRLETIFEMIKNPFTENQKFEEYAKLAPQEYQNLCVSCSS